MNLRNKLTKEIVGTAPVYSYEEVKQFFKTKQQAWEASEAYKELRSALLSTKTPPKIYKVVGFACASMIKSLPKQRTDRSAYQHAMLLTLRDVFSKKSEKPEPIICYAQDPSYTKIDESVLKESGVTVLDDPKAFLVVDDSTVVVSCAANVPVKEIISDLARPAVMIWDRVYKDESKVM